MTPDGGRILAIDLGEVRIGLALSDPLRITAQPAGCLPRTHTRRDAEAIASLAVERGVVRVVVGLPLLLSGEAGTRARDAEGFVAELRARMRGVEVDLWDERLTTKEAERVLIAGDVKRRRRKEVLDSLAAVLILQSYLQGKKAGDEAR